MHGFAVAILLGQACANELLANSIDRAQMSYAGALADQLVGRALNVFPSSFHLPGADVDNATFGKSGNLAISPSKSLKSVAPLRAFPGQRGYRTPFRREALSGRHTSSSGISMNGRSWSESLALPSCSSLLDRPRRLHTPVATEAVATERETWADKSSIVTQIEEIIALQPAVIFSKTTCPFCAKAKEAFKQVGVNQVSVVELDTLQPEVANEIQDHLMTLTGARTVPRVFVGHEFIGGGSEVAQMADNGQLKGIVEDAMGSHREDLQGKDIAKLGKLESEWKEELRPEVYRILRQRGTEMPHSHEYNQFYPAVGYFSCAGCGLPLYSAKSKFKSNCGWPVFDKCYHSEEVGCHVCTRPDGTGSLEILCPKCSGHLGHVFFDSFSAENPNGERH